jgi:RNA-directed DNA polymerase
MGGLEGAIIPCVYEPIERTLLAEHLSEAIAAGGAWTQDAVAERAASALDRWPRWLDALALTIAANDALRAPQSRRGQLAQLITRFLAGHALPAGEPDNPPGIIRLLARSHAGAPRPAEASRQHHPLSHDWPIAQIASVAELADRLELSAGQLAWLADVKGWERNVRDLKLRNYRSAAVPRRSGLPRLIEAPKARLKEIQRWILREVLNQVPPHAAAHGFTPSRSVHTHAEPHVGQAALLRLDLKDFFASVTAARVYGLFRTIGYAGPVSIVLTGLTTNVVPGDVWGSLPQNADPRLIQPRFWLGRQLATPHLPQGAPTSPALANLAAYRLDRRLSGLAVRHGLRYTRYADDLTFSGGRLLSRRTRPLPALIATIVREEGFALNPDKRSLATASARQSVCGIVVNERPNVTRAEYDLLKAILHNAAHHGSGAQNRTQASDYEAHLRGRIEWVASLNPSRGEKLRKSFALIQWGPRS